VVSAVVLVNIAKGKIASAGEAIAAIEGVTEVFSVAGRVDLVANIRVKTNEDLAGVVSEKIGEVDGVEATETLIAFRVYSRDILEAGFSIGS
jgi:DNA-binding Lrp family transcriptional regulator